MSNFYADRLFILGFIQLVLLDMSLTGLLIHFMLPKNDFYCVVIISRVNRP